MHADEGEFEEVAAAFNKASQLAAADGEADANCLGWAARDTSTVLSPFKFKRRELGPKDVFLKITHAGGSRVARARGAGGSGPAAWWAPRLTPLFTPPAATTQACATATCTPSTATGDRRGASGLAGLPAATQTGCHTSAQQPLPSV